MCRFTFYRVSSLDLSSLLTEPALFRSISPAWSDDNLRHLARVVESGCVLAMVEAHADGAPSRLNVALSDGEAAAICRSASGDPERAESLYVSEGRRYVCENGRCRMLEPEPGERSGPVSSEPLSADESWRVVPPNHVVLIDAGLDVRIRPMEV